LARVDGHDDIDDVDLRYEAFCLADPLFFDEQRANSAPADAFTGQVRAPQGWVVNERGIWRSLHPEGHILPLQGWKIHVSATLSNADRVLSTTAAYCGSNRLAFKHLRGRTTLLARNSKYAPREGSGKLLTIYPVDEAQFATTLAKLSALLEGEPGPYILSDLRYGDGPLYVRYGGFAERWAEVDGTRVHAVLRPDGHLVPDERKPTFVLPDWVKLPECLAPHLAARKSGDPSAFPYRVTSPLHFSNGGGVYRAIRQSDDGEVVLKEARPHAGLDRDGRDAVARLHHEHAALDRLLGIPGIPRVYRRFTVWEHHFLELEPMPGIPLGSWVARHYPLTRSATTPELLADYTTRALAVLDAVTATLDAVHRRGVVFGDLHPQNILIEETENGDRVSLIDFEMASEADEPTRPGLGAPGFRSVDGTTGIALDDHALAVLRLWLFLPVAPMLELAPGKLQSLMDQTRRRFPLPDNHYAGLVASAESPPTELDRTDPDWLMVRKSIAGAILASATPQRTDRLFPGDIETFRLGGACFGYGAAGILYALHVAGEGRYPEHERWLLNSVRGTAPSRPGFLDGAHGIAFVLDAFGHETAADELLAASTTMTAQTTAHGLASGLAGIALTHLYLGVRRRDRDMVADAVTIAERLLHGLEHAEGPGPVGRAGLHDGWSGPALLFLRLYQVTGDVEWLNHADRALRRDLDECVITDDGSLQVRDGTRTLPYAGVGSAGIALVAARLAKAGGGFPSLERVPALLDSCRAEFCVHPGLFYGRAGLMSALAAHGRRDAVTMHLSRFAWNAVPFAGGIAFPGNQLLRLSMDVVTGGAGVLLALAALFDGHGAVLPFLGEGRPHDLRPPAGG
jgi:serine/threonine protein kinase